MFHKDSRRLSKVLTLVMLEEKTSANTAGYFKLQYWNLFYFS